MVEEKKKQIIQQTTITRNFDDSSSDESDVSEYNNGKMIEKLKNGQRIFVDKINDVNIVPFSGGVF